MKKVILDLCGGTGAWSKPYADAGFQVHVITLPDFDITKTSFTKDAILFKDPNGDRPMENPSNYILFKDVYGILCAPPCTMFSLARTTAKRKRDLGEGMALVEACLKIVWEVRKRTKLKFWALENPQGLLRQFLGKPALIFNPCDYGNPYTKKTDLWGFFNDPKKSPVPLNDQQMRDCSINSRILPEIPDGYKRPKGDRSDKIRRAITPSGFAKAFFEANK